MFYEICALRTNAAATFDRAKARGGHSIQASQERSGKSVVCSRNKFVFIKNEPSGWITKKKKKIWIFLTFLDLTGLESPGTLSGKFRKMFTVNSFTRFDFVNFLRLLKRNLRHWFNFLFLLFFLKKKFF